MKTSAQCLFRMVLFMACLKLQSQTLTSQHNCPQPGQLYSIKTCSPVYGTPGLNQVWNFTQVAAVSAGVGMVSYLAPSITPSANLFPQATVARSKSGDYTYFETDATGVKLAIASNVTVNAQPVILPLPFQYGSSHTETITTAYYNGTTKVEVLTTKTLNAVGTGTLILPTGTYTDVLLVTGKAVESRTLAGAAEGNTITNNFSYFYSEKIAHHLLYTEYKWETGQVDYGPYTEFIAGLYTGVANETMELNPAIELAPNPASDRVRVTLSDTDSGEALLVNGPGEIVRHFYYPGNNFELDVSDLPPGLYMLTAIQGNKTQHKKLIVSR